MRIHRLYMFVLAGAIALTTYGCDIFSSDGTSSDIITGTDGYFYMMDRSNSTLYQLDSQLVELTKWDLSDISGGNIVQGITFDGSNVWISVASGINRLFKLDLTFPEAEIMQTIVAPPSGRGTIRDITFDGNHLWAANSGSISASESPAMYKINPESGDVVASYNMPTTEIRSVSYVPPNGDEYGRGMISGIYLGDREANIFWNFRFDRPVFTEGFNAPVPPEGQFRIFPSGLTYELLSSGEIKLWSINSSLGANYLFRINRLGNEDQRFEMKHYEQPGPIVFTTVNVAIPAAPEVTAMVPNRGAWDTTFDVEIIGSAFRAGPDLAVDLGQGITVTNVAVQTPGVIQATVAITGGTPIGQRDVVVTNGDGQAAMLANAFEITEEPPKFGYIYVGDFGSLNLLYRLREADGGLDKQWNYSEVAPGGSLQGITFDGEHIWIAAAGSDRLIMQLDTSTDDLEILRSIPAPYQSGTGTVRDIKYHEGAIWATNSGDSKVYELDLANGNILREFDTPGSDTRAITFANGTLYAAERSNGLVYTWNEGTGEWSEAFRVPLPPGASTADRLPVGMDFDGQNFWISITRLSSDFVLEVSPDGQLLRHFASPNVGSDILSGLTFTLE